MEHVEILKPVALLAGWTMLMTCAKAIYCAGHSPFRHP